MQDKKVFGQVKAGILLTYYYTTIVYFKFNIEFQKRGLSPAHILLFMYNKSLNIGDIDDIISAELSNKLIDPNYYVIVTNFMMHDPYGSVRKSSPCMQTGKCSKHILKRFISSIPQLMRRDVLCYRRRDDGTSTKRSSIDLDNRYVVHTINFCS